MAKRGKHIGVDDPLFLNDHSRPKTRREFIAQGFMAGTGTVLGTSFLGMLPGSAHGDLPADLEQAIEDLECGFGGGDEFRIPFISFDLAGGANIAGSNVLVGQEDQMDFLGTDGYRKQGLRADEAPNTSNSGDTVDEFLGLRFHTNSAMLAGIRDTLSADAAANVDGIVIPARSQNDTGNNPHNPMYAIYAAGARGTQADLIGSRNSDSGANSMAPADFMSFVGAEVRPAKVDNENDVMGFQDVGKLATLLPDNDNRLHVMRGIYRMSDRKLSAAGLATGFGSTEDAEIKRRLRCAYLKSASLADGAEPATLNPITDPAILDIFSGLGLESDREFVKTASVMKMVLDLQQKAAAGTISMGGYDYHTGDRVTGEDRDLRAGRCMGAVLEYAHQQGLPVCLYVYSDGSVFSNGMEDPMNGRLVWTGDNQQTAASFMLVYNPSGRTGIVRDTARRQIGSMSNGGDVNTSSSAAANNVGNLVQTVLLNYLALHGLEDQLQTVLTHPSESMLNIVSNVGLLGTGDPLDAALMDQHLRFGNIV